MSITVKDVAADAAVSLGTVSRVLNGDPTVDSAIRERVSTAMRKLGYTRLRKRSTNGQSHILKGRNIALVLLGMDRSLVGIPSVSAAIHGVEAALAEAEANMLLADIPRADHLPTVLSRNRIDGVLLKGALQGGLIANAAPALLERLRCIPSVWFLGRPVGAWGDVIQADDSVVGELAAAHLLAHGHRELGFINPKPDQVTFLRRQASFEWHARQSGAAVTTFLGRAADWQLPLATVNATAVDELVERFLNHRPRLTAAFIPGDSVAAMVYRALARRNVTMGKDVSIISCNNEQPLLSAIYPSLTTIDIHAEEIGKRAVDQLAWRLSHHADPAADTGIAPTLSLGQSIAMLSGAL